MSPSAKTLLPFKGVRANSPTGQRHALWMGPQELGMPYPMTAGNTGVRTPDSVLPPLRRGLWGSGQATKGQACPVGAATPSLGGESQARDGSGGCSLAASNGVGRALSATPIEWPLSGRGLEDGPGVVLKA